MAIEEKTDQLMPRFDPPWKRGEVRPEYAKGMWAYALGKPAWTHPEYAKAVQIAKHGRKNRPSFNPWWIRNWSDVCAVLDGCYMDEDLARIRMQFTGLCRQYTGRYDGHPLTLSDWQQYDIQMPMFGWLRPNGFRRFRRGHIEIPKKNGKTTWAAETILYLLVGDREPAAEIFSAAVDQDQNEKIYDAVYYMGMRSSAIRQSCQFVKSRWRVIHVRSASVYRALSAKAISAEGKNIHGLVEEELHVHPNRVMHDTLKHGGANRDQPLFFAITTAGVFDPTSIGWEQHAFALMVMNAQSGAEKSWEFFPYVCGLSKEEEDRWTEPAMAVKANPNMGMTIKLDDYMELVKEAQVKPSEESVVKRYRLNIWVNALNAWLPMAAWEACTGDYAEADVHGKVCYGGLDCSLSKDITALVLWFPKQDGIEKPRMICRFWVPEEGVPKFDDQYNGLYSHWIREGHLLTTPGPTIRQEFIRNELVNLREFFSIRTIGYDRAFAQNLADQLESDGFDVGAFGQGFAAMNEPCTEFERLVLEGEMEHPKNPVMNWHVSNGQIVKDGGDRIRVVKNWGGGKGQAKVRYKVDGLVAAIMALGTSRLDETPVDMNYEVIWS